MFRPSIILLSSRWFFILSTLIILFIIWHLINAPLLIPQILTICFATITFADICFLLFGNITATRKISERLSNGDWNSVEIDVDNKYGFPIKISITDELPEQFQIRNHRINKTLRNVAVYTASYKLKPFERGEYEFGHILLFVQSFLGLAVKKIKTGEPKTVAVYPSFIQMRKYDILAQSAQNNNYGSKRIRKIGHSMEFEQIKDYVTGDDVRSINWKATARRENLMVNHYTDERSQQVYCVIDKGRLMKMPFEQLTLLDYAINASLVLSSISLYRQDKTGIITFSNKLEPILIADKKAIQLEHILQMLYKQKTNFLESDYEKLYFQIRTYIKQRSLLILFTNFESINGLKRQLPYLKKLASHHLLLTVFFENTELKKLSNNSAEDIESLYTKVIAEKFNFEKKMIVKELSNHGILSILTTPQELTVNVINKYLEIKLKQAI